MNYGKILKWSTVGFLVLGLIFSVYGFINGWPTTEDISTVAKAEESIESAKGNIEFAKSSIDDAKKELSKAIDTVAIAIDAAEKAATAVTEAKSKSEKAAKQKALVKAEEAAYKLIEEEYFAKSQLKISENALKTAEKDFKTTQSEIESAESRIFSVQLIIIGGYIFAAITILSVIFGVVVLGGMNNPKSLIKLGIGVVAIIVIVLLAIVIAPDAGDSAKDIPVELANKLQATGDLNGALSLTDTMMNLTYLLGAGTIAALIASWIIGFTRK